MVGGGLIDAHGHGRGLSPIQKGVPYDDLGNAVLSGGSPVVADRGAENDHVVRDV